MSTITLQIVQAELLIYNNFANLVGKSGNFLEAIPFYQRAIELDPNFALAYIGLGTQLVNLWQSKQAEEPLQKAYSLRDRVTEPEKLLISERYFTIVTGDLEKARQTNEIWASTYPRTSTPHNSMGLEDWAFGQFDRALAEHQESARLSPANRLLQFNLVHSYLRLNHTDEALAIAERASANTPDFSGLHACRYLAAFLRNDASGMARVISWAVGKRGFEDIAYSSAGLTAAYYGQALRAEELSQRSADLAAQIGKKEVGAADLANSAWTQALFGNQIHAQRNATAALTRGPNRYGEATAALGLAYAGNLAVAQSHVDALAKRFPNDTVLQSNLLPSIRAILALRHSNPSQALSLLQPTESYELGNLTFHSNSPSLTPIYVRGEAYLALHNGSAAAAEFQKILDHPGAALNNLVGALSRLGLARAYTLQGNTTKARSAYQDFFTLWKDADPDLPVLRAAKSEYFKLK